jgi:microcystin-dependent protein
MAQDTTPAIIVYQGNGSNKTFSVPFDKGDYGAIKVAFVRRGLTNYEYNPTTYTVNGCLFAWALANTSPVQYYYTKPNDSKVYNAQNNVVSGVTLTSMADSSAKFSNGKTGYRALAQDISFHSSVEWLGEPLTKNDWICIVRETQSNQPYVYPNNQKHIEGALDNLSRQIQELKAQSDISLKVDATFEKDARKLNPIDWLNTIARSTDGTARGFRFRDFWLEFSTDDPNKAEADKTWTRLLNTTNITTVREYYDKDKNVSYPEYSKDGGRTWVPFGRVLQNQIDGINEEIDDIQSDVSNLYSKTSTNASNIATLKIRADGHDTHLAQHDQDISELQTQAVDLYSKHTSLKNRVDRHDDDLTELDESVADLKSTKLDKNQGKVHSGKTMMVDENGYIVPKASAEDSGLRAVSHDNSMNGAGTDEDPLRLAETISGNRTFKDGVKTPKLNNGADISVPTVGGTLARTEDIDSKITNCITEIPQDIKLELADGVVTIKAGSKIRIPKTGNVFEDYVFTSNITRSGGVNGSAFLVALFNVSNNKFAQTFTVSLSKSCSGTTDTLAGTPQHLWYDTANNILKYYGNDGVTNNYYAALPLAIVSGAATITSIDQVFNGLGYIGSTVFALPGVKGLIPNGRNEDGTLKNATFNTNNVLTVQVSKTTTKCISLNNNKLDVYRGYVVAESTTGALYSMWYQPSSNIMFNTANNKPVKATLTYIIEVSYDGDKITYFNPKTVFHAVDYNDFEELDNSAVHKTGNETIGGEKTFTSTIRMNGQYLHFDGIDSAATQSFKDIDAYDTNGATVGGVRIEHSSTNGRSVSLITRKADGSVGGNLGVRTKPDGTYSSFAPTPASTSNSTEIATTAWVNSAAVHKAGDETVAGTKTFTAPYLQVTNAAGTGGSGIKISDSNGKGSSELVHYYTGGNYYTRLISWNATANKYAYIEIIAGDDGNMRFTNANLNSMTAPTPASTSNSTDVATTAWVNSKISADLPAGVVVPFGGTSVPSGWLKCDGSAVSRTTYAKLFAAIGTRYGTGNGSTTFNLPTQSVLPLGLNANVSVLGTGKTLGLTDGSNFGSIHQYGTFIYHNSQYNSNVGSATSGGPFAQNKALGVTTDSSKSGLKGTVNLANATGAKAIVCIKY